MKKEDLIFIIVVAALTLFCIVVAGVLFVSAGSMETHSAPSSIIHPMAEAAPIDFSGVVSYLPYIAAVIVVGGLLWLIGKSPNGQTIFVLLIGIALLFGIGYAFLYGDKNGDGQEDAMVISVVQPTGSLEVDQGYANINNVNAGANLKNAGSFMVYVLLFLISSIVLSFVGIVIKSRG